MKCEKYQKLISDWLDGQINEKNIKKIEAHLHSCELCRSYYEEQKLINHYYKNAHQPDFSSAFWNEFERNLYEKVELEKEKENSANKKAPGHFPAPVWAAAGLGMVLILIISGIYFFRRAPSQEVIPSITYSDEEFYLNLNQIIVNDEELARNFNEEIVKSIDEQLKKEYSEALPGEIYNYEEQFIQDESKNNLQLENMSATEVQL